MNIKGYEIVIIPDDKGNLIRNNNKLFNDTVTHFFRCNLEGFVITDGEYYMELGTLNAKVYTLCTYFEQWDTYEYNLIYQEIKKQLGSDINNWKTTKKEYKIFSFLRKPSNI